MNDLHPLRPTAALRWLRRFEFPHKLGILERLFGASLARQGVCWMETSAGIAWKLDLANPTHRWIVFGNYEGSAFLEWAKSFLPRDGFIVDSGANIGQMLLYLAQWVPDGKVLAIEPGHEAADWLEECLAANPGLRVEVVRCALGSQDGEMSLLDTGPAHLHGACNQIGAAGAGPIVPVRRLADLARVQGIATIDLWKLDVEGYELEALAGAGELLAAGRIRAIYAELGFGHGEEIRARLRGWNYDCFQFSPAGPLQPAGSLAEHAYGLFLPR